MRKFERSPAPGFLSEKWKDWGAAWKAKHTANPGSTFYWHQVDGEPVNQKLVPLLKALTQDHCSFCDNFPVTPPSDDTIEHFRPKTRYHLDAYKWENLYFCCRFCQQKSDKFDENALCPDEVGYEFERYFRWDYTNGTIHVNELASAADQKRAEVTINLYRLNDEHPRHRKRALLHRGKCPDDPLDEWPYREFIKAS